MLRILGLFDIEHRRWKIGDIAKATGYDRTTVYRIVQTMEAERALVRAPDGGSYELGSGLVTLLFALDPYEQLRQLIRPSLQKLADLSGESLVLGVQCNLDTLILDFVLTRNAFKPFIAHGQRFTGLTNAHAKIFTAFSSPDRRARLLQAFRATATPAQLAQIDAFETEIDRIRSEGVVFDLGEETAPGVYVVVGPVLYPGLDEVRIGIGILTSPERGTPEEMRRLAGIVREGCQRISDEIGVELYALIRQTRDHSV